MHRLLTFFLTIPLLGALVAPTAAQSPTTTDELLAGMVTEEVEPGVFRVDNDGVRDLSGMGTWGLNALAIAPDGVVWVCSERTARLFRLGGAEARAVECPLLSMAVAANGSVWLIDLDKNGVRSFDGATWAEYGSDAEDGRHWRDLSTAPDGTVWALALDAACRTDLRPCNERVLVRIDADGGITDMAVSGDILDQPLWIDDLAVAPDGDVWVTVLAQHGGWDVATLLRYDGTAWEAVAPPQGTLSQNDVAGQALGFAPDGTLWIGTGSTPDGNTGLARLDGSGWTVFSAEDGVRAWGTPHRWIFLADLEVAPDGSVWVNAASEQPMTGGCGGVARFDGSAWTEILVGTCVDDLDIAPDGAVWVVGESEETAYAGSGSTDLYVITPEVVAGTGADRLSVASSADITLIPTDDPAVFEVISEPHREWLHADERPLGPLAIDGEGGVWVQGWEGEVLYVTELGVPGRTEFGRTGDTGAFTPMMDDLAPTADGTLWGAGASAGLRSFDGEAWTRHSPGPWPTELADDLVSYEFQGVVDLTEAPDGALYGITEGGELVKVEDGEVFRRLLGNDWAGMWLAARAVAATADGTIWVGGREGSGVGIFADTGTGLLLRLDGLSSEVESPLGVGVDPYVADLAVAPDGALWALLRTADDSYLARYDGQAWTTYSAADGLPEVGARTFAGNGDRLAVGPDGRVWFSLFQHYPEEPVTEGDGLVEFDGESFERHLEGVHVEDLAIASDGSVWTSTDQGLYVVIPEAVAANV